MKNLEKNLLSRFKGHSKKRGHPPPTITFEEIASLIVLPCEYCGTEILSRSLDRLDNSKGYDLNNVVSCCEHCNMARNDHFTSEQMRKRIGPAIWLVREDLVDEFMSTIPEGSWIT
jgi:hypothetical protein